MSDSTSRETLQAITGQELIETHRRLNLSTAASQRRGLRELAKLSLGLFDFGLWLQFAAEHSGWEEQFGLALRSGSDRLFLPTLKLLKPVTPTAAQVQTIGWLRSLHPNFSWQIKKEATAIIVDNEDKDVVTERAEDEILGHGYTAFVELSSSLEAYLLGEELTTGEAPMQEASMARAGMALGGLAISRTLATRYDDPFEEWVKL